jgi:8-oxo-dGTP pyrophosphatase MutT (NUDIX family)
VSTKTPSTPLPAATILLLRDQPAFEVLMVKRHHQIDFASGALVFPGGKTAPGDHDPGVGRSLHRLRSVS